MRWDGKVKTTLLTIGSPTCTHGVLILIVAECN